MTAGELITQLSQHSPDTPVRVVVEDEFDRYPSVDVACLDRVVRPDGTYIEVIGAYA